MIVESRGSVGPAVDGHGGYWRTAFLVCLPTSKIALKIVSGPIFHAKHAGNIKSDLHPGKPFVAFVALEYKLGFAQMCWPTLGQLWSIPGQRWPIPGQHYRFQANIGRFSANVAGISEQLGLEHKLGFA